MQHPALELRHLRRRHALGFSEAVERAQKIAPCVAEPAIGIDLEFQDLRADALIVLSVARHDPETKDVGALTLTNVLRRHDIAQGFGHLATLLIEREAVGHDRLERRSPARAARFEQRGLEPAAMLVRPLAVEIGGPSELGACLEHESMSRAAFEPYVDDVAHLLELIRIVGIS